MLTTSLSKPQSMDLGLPDKEEKDKKDLKISYIALKNKNDAEAVYQIIQNPSPRIHYKVGIFMQQFSIVLKRILPDKVYEKMLMNHYKL